MFRLGSVAEQFLSKQFLLFLGVGLTAAFLHWLARVGLSQFLSFSVAVVAAYGVGIATAFVLNRLFVFPNSQKPKSHQFRTFIIVNLLFFPPVWVIAVVLEQWVLPFLGFANHVQEIAHGIAISFPILGSFLIHKYVTFAFPDNTEAGSLS